MLSIPKGKSGVLADRLIYQCLLQALILNYPEKLKAPEGYNEQVNK